MLKNVKKENIRPASIDLQLGAVYIFSKMKIVDVEKGKVPKHTSVSLPYVLKPGEYVLGKTIEIIEQKNKKYACLLSARSRAFRYGLSVQTNYWGPYYKGPIIFGIKNISHNPVKLFKGLSIVQLSFLDIKGQTNPVMHDFQSGRMI